MNFIIRPARHEDAESIILAHQNSIKGICAKDYSETEITAWTGRKEKPQTWKNAIDRDYIRVVESEGRVLGFGHFAVMSEETGELLGLYFLPEVTGRGIAKELMNDFIHLAHKKALKKIELHSTKTAKGFYERLGFLQHAGDTTIDMLGVPIPCHPMSITLPSP